MDYKKIRAIRKAQNKSQDDLAQHLGVNRATVSKYETGVIEPSLSQLAQIAQFLNVRLDVFLGEVETFGTGAEFEAEWERRTQNTTVPGIEIQYKADGSTVVVDPRKEKLDRIYRQLDEPDQQQFVKYGEFLLSDPKYKEKPPQD